MINEWQKHSHRLSKNGLDFVRMHLSQANCKASCQLFFFYGRSLAAGQAVGFHRVLIGPMRSDLYVDGRLRPASAPTNHDRNRELPPGSKIFVAFYNRQNPISSTLSTRLPASTSHEALRTAIPSRVNIPRCAWRDLVASTTTSLTVER